MHLVNKKNRALLSDFVDNGGKVILVSSRSGSFLEKLKDSLKHDLDYIASDGTLINIGGQCVFDRTFEPESCKKLLSDLRRDYDPGLIIMSTTTRPNVVTRTNVSKMTNLMYFIYMAFQGAYKEPVVRSDSVFYEELNKGQVRKLMILIGLTKANQKRAEEITGILKQRYPDFEFVWCNQFIEITPKGCSKAHALSFCLDYLKINSHNVAVVGDSGNDAPMFQAFYENSYCMGHAKKSIRGLAKHTIARYSDLRPVLCPSEDSTPSEKEGKRQ